MGVSEKPYGSQMDAEKWVIAAVPPWRDLKPVFTKAVDSKADKQEEELSTTPTSEESRIPSRLTCPPPPRKRKPSSSSSSSSSSRCGIFLLKLLLDLAKLRSVSFALCVSVFWQEMWTAQQRLGTALRLFSGDSMVTCSKYENNCSSNREGHVEYI
ncbi:hypothetical protein RJ639_000364 [Escallonia herrerae]|uniref:Uncharacterized protein n=1 Tax=Escallonia herrerae TaxID=1293975 RepID=A0AA89BI14_9ASTE|nr:hypothetical protein RJ639_000364 [Escallonia herrerae]